MFFCNLSIKKTISAMLFDEEIIKNIIPNVTDVEIDEMNEKIINIKALVDIPRVNESQALEYAIDSGGVVEIVFIDCEHHDEFRYMVDSEGVVHNNSGNIIKCK